jgi:hypothetical protein
MLIDCAVEPNLAFFFLATYPSTEPIQTLRRVQVQLESDAVTQRGSVESLIVEARLLSVQPGSVHAHAMKVEAKIWKCLC